MNKKITDYWGRNFDEPFKLIRENAFDFYFFKGGRGSGKSSFISLAIVLGIVRNPKTNAIIYRKVGSTVGESVFSQIGWAIATLGLSDYFKAKVSPYKYIYLPTGQEILFKGCDDPVKSKSIKLKDGYFGYCWFEELTEFNGLEEIESIVQSIARSAEGKTAILGSYNPPKSSQSWINAEVLIPKTNRFVHHSTYLDIPRELIGEQFINIAEDTRLTNETKYRHIYLGEVTGTGGEIFQNIKLEEIKQVQINNFEYRYCGMDFGFTIDPTAIILMYINKNILYIYDEKYSPGLTYKQIADWLQSKGNPVCFADSAEPRSIDELRKNYSCRVLPVEKGKDSVEFGIKRLQELEKIIIDPARCPNSAREFCQYEYEKDRNGNFYSAFPDKNNHAIDATRYALRRYFTQNNLYSL